MKIEALHIGQAVTHPQYGKGVVKSVNEHTADIHFETAGHQTVSPVLSGLEPAETQAELKGLEMPLALLIRQTVEAAAESLGLERPDEALGKLGARWHKGHMVLHPADPALQTKEVDLTVFFHKIVMIRNNLRVLEQKINGDEKLSDAEKVEWQQYITRCYGSLTTFNVLFREKEDQF